jgi:hypothetical protein
LAKKIPGRSRGRTRKERRNGDLALVLLTTLAGFLLGSGLLALLAGFLLSAAALLSALSALLSALLATLASTLTALTALLLAGPFVGIVHGYSLCCPPTDNKPTQN